jgi:hypothetical protein
VKLREIYDKRKGETQFKERDIAYRVFEGYYQARDPKKPGVPQITYRPYLIDTVTTASEDNHRYAVNLSRGVITYFGATFAKPPRMWKTPLGDDLKDADRQTAWLRSVFKNSRMGTLQPRQSHWLALRGDAVYGVDWDEKENKILIRTYDPAWCFPQFSALDLGAVEDMLIATEVPTRWVKQKYGVEVAGDTTMLFIYWDDEIQRVDIGEVEIESQRRTHKLGFCPFRWVFGSADGTLAQADVRDLASLQDLYNENLLLAMDSVRRQVDPAYFGTGIKGNLQPIAGEVLGIPNENAKIAPFPTTVEPQVIMGVMSMLGEQIHQISGMSPISASGQARGSIVTGTAVRNQVEAMEARTETRRTTLEDAFMQVGEQCFKVLETIFPTKEQTFPTKAGMDSIKGEDIKGWYECQAQYGDILGLSPRERMMVAMQGLGHIYDDKMAIRLADLPDVTPEEMVTRMADYNDRQAIAVGRGQGLGQVAAQAVTQKPPDTATGAPPGPPPGSAPQKPSPPPTPGMAGMNVTIEDVSRALEMVKVKLKGPVFATGDLAVVGMSANPMVVVGVQRDLPIVNSVMAGLHGIAVAEAPSGMPRLEVA